MAYPPPQQNQPPYHQPPYDQSPPYGYPPQYPYQQPPQKNNSGVIIALLLVVIVVAGGMVGFVLLGNAGKCVSSELVGTWRETAGLETLYITSSTIRAEGSGLVISGSYTCSGNTIMWTLSNGQTTTHDVIEKSGLTMQLKNAFGMTSNYRKQ